MNPTGHAGPPEDDDRAGRPVPTHAEQDAGEPRLVISSEGIHHTFALTADQVRIGSAPDCELQLDGIEELHAEILRGPDDEHVLVVRGSTGGGESAETALKTTGEVLRTGAEFVLGPWRFVFVRAELADRGRPDGGRDDGERPRRQPRPSRPEYTRLHPTSEENARAHRTEDRD